MPFLHLIITAISKNDSLICLTTSTVSRSAGRLRIVVDSEWQNFFLKKGGKCDTVPALIYVVWRVSWFSISNDILKWKRGTPKAGVADFKG